MWVTYARLESFGVGVNYELYSPLVLLQQFERRNESYTASQASVRSACTTQGVCTWPWIHKKIVNAWVHSLSHFVVVRSRDSALTRCSHDEATSRSYISCCNCYTQLLSYKCAYHKTALGSKARMCAEVTDVLASHVATGRWLRAEYGDCILAHR